MAWLTERLRFPRGLTQVRLQGRHDDQWKLATVDHIQLASYCELQWMSTTICTRQQGVCDAVATEASNVKAGHMAGRKTLPMLEPRACTSELISGLG